MASIKGQEKARLALEKIEANKKIIKKIKAFLETEFTNEKLIISHENGKTPFICDEETIKELLNDSEALFNAAMNAGYSYPVAASFATSELR